MPLRLAFMGTPDFAVPALKALIVSGHEIACVYSRPPKPKGRGHEVQKSPVHEAAEQAGLVVRTPKTLRSDEAAAEFAALNLDLAIVAAYGLILPKSILDAPKLGCLNLHGSLLPRWRGAAPIQRSILAGDSETGICLMAMEEGLDTGGVYARAALPITPGTTASSLHDDLSELAARLLMDNLDAFAAGALSLVPQPSEGVTYAAKLEKAEAQIDWSKPAREIERQVRAFTPWPAAICTIGAEAVKVLKAEVVAGASGPPGTLLDDHFTIACGQEALRMLTVQRPGRGPVEGAACLRGLSLKPGAKLAAS